MHATLEFRRTIQKTVNKPMKSIVYDANIESNSNDQSETYSRQRNLHSKAGITSIKLLVNLD